MTALGATLELHESRFGGEIDEVSKKPFPPEWRPKTNADVWDPRRKALAYLDNIGQGSDEAAVCQHEENAFGPFAHWCNTPRQMTHLKFLSPAFRKLTKNGARCWSHATGFQRCRGCQVISKAEFRLCVTGRSGPTTLAGFASWTGKRIHGDFDMNSASGYGAADDRVRHLAEEGFQTRAQRN